MGDRESKGDAAYRILVIDDDDQVRDTVRAILVKAGFEVAVAADGDEGLTLHGANPAHVVISDIIMPGKEGIETIIELRRTCPDLGIIAMSGAMPGGTLDFLEFAAKLGTDRILAKPFSAEILLGAVRDLLPPAATPI